MDICDKCKHDYKSYGGWIDQKWSECSNCDKAEEIPDIKEKLQESGKCKHFAKDKDGIFHYLGRN